MERKVNRRLKLSEKQWICRTKRDHPGFSNSRIAQNVREEFGITVTRESIRKTLSKEAEIMAAMVEEAFVKLAAEFSFRVQSVSQTSKISNYSQPERVLLFQKAVKVSK